MTTKKKTASKSKNEKADAARRSTGSVGSATLASILGQTSGSSKSRAKNGQVKVKPEWAKYHQNLMDLREQLRRQVDGLAKESAEQMAGYSLHMADSGTDNFDRDFALSLLSADQDAIYEIEEAIKRIERNEYGVCELTGKHIPKARLSAIPWTRYTVEAQAQLEREGVSRMRRLGSLGSVDSTGASSVTSGDDDEDSPSDSKPAPKEKEEKD